VTRSRAPGAAAAGAAACLFCFAAAFGFPQPPRDTGVERQKPRSVNLSTEMGKEVYGYLYAPPAAPGEAPSPGGSAQGGAQDAGPAAASPLPVVYLSGEWGWTPMLQDTASFLALKGRHVLGIDVTTYFRKMIDGAAMGRDLDLFRATVNEAAGKPKDSPVLLAGFAYGASLVPFVLNRAGVKGVHGALLVGAGDTGGAVYRVAIQLKMDVPSEEAFSVPDEIRRLPPIPVVVLEGAQDERAKGRSFFPMLQGPRKYIPIPGADHQFNEDRPLYYHEVLASVAWLETQVARLDVRDFPGHQAPTVRPIPVSPGPGYGTNPPPAARPSPSPAPTPQ